MGARACAATAAPSGRSPATASSSSPCTRAAEGCTSSWPMRSCRRSRPARGAACAGCPARARGGPGAAPACCGRARRRANTRCTSARGLLDAGGAGRLAALWPLDRSRSRPFCVSDQTVAALYAERLGELAGTIAIPPGEAHKTLASAERVWRGADRRGHDPRRPCGGARRRRGRRPGGLLRGHLPARRAGRARAHDARRAGRLRLRRQDRRGPAAGEELRRRLPPAGGRARRPGHALDAARPRSSPPAGSRCSRRR